MPRKNKFNAMLTKLGSAPPKAVPTKPKMPVVETSTPVLMRQLMLEALRIGEDTLAAIAAELIVRCGAETAHRLALVATDPRSTTKHRLRVLDVLGRIGDIRDPVAFMDLFGLMSSKNAEVRSAAVKLIATLQQGKAPNAPDQLAAS